MILVINCGSSSAKYQFFDLTDNRSLAKGIVERIGEGASSLMHQAYCESSPHRSIIRKVSCGDHRVAIEIIVRILTDKKYGVINSWRQITGIGHRVVHGGEEFKESMLITNRVRASILKHCDIAPLHNPPSLLGIKACGTILKGIPQVAVFDTSFHQTMPKKAFLYGIPIEYYKRYGVRRYGFHGTSHRFIAKRAAEILRKPPGKIKLITCHLGNGCSMTAVERGVSVDTTMGFTPLEGLLMGTRSGDMDPAIVFYLSEKASLSIDRINSILNRESGLLGVSGVSNDMRDILKVVKSDTPRAERSKLAIEIFVYRIEKYIGAYLAAMRGLDAVVFTGGISENQPWLIRRIEKDLRGIVGKKVKFMVVPTNEELLIAEDTYRIINREPRAARSGIGLASCMENG